MNTNALHTNFFTPIHLKCLILKYINGLFRYLTLSNVDRRGFTDTF